MFAFCILSLLLAILMTMCTDPGSVPQDREFDAPSNEEVHEIVKKFSKGEVNSEDSIETIEGSVSEQLINKSLERDQKYPLNSTHIDMGLILSKQGPLYKNEYGDPDDTAYLEKMHRKLQMQQALVKQCSVE